MITKTKKSKDDQPMTFENPIAQIFEDVDNENAPSEEDRYDTLAKQIAELQSQNAEMQKANMALLQQPQWRSQVTDNQPIEVKPESVALPDPALDPDGYDAALAQRNRIREDNSRRALDVSNRRQLETKERVDDLWNSFSEKYPDLAADQDRIDFVATKVAQAAQKRGIDIERYMFVTRETFLDDVAKKYYSVFGEPELEDDNDDNFEDAPRRQRAASNPPPRNRSRNRNRQEDNDVGRTGGIFGGTESGGRPSRGRDADDESGPSMIDDIQAIQRKTGFF